MERFLGCIQNFHEIFCFAFNSFQFFVDTVFKMLFFSPWRIVDDCGGAFAMGAIGGSVFHSIKGFRHAPSVRY